MARRSVPAGRVVELSDVSPWQCQHYRCRNTDVMPVAYRVLGATFVRLFCSRHGRAVSAA